MNGSLFAGQRVLVLLGLLLFSFALLGKTAAYLHLGPIYIAEILLGLGIVAYLLSHHKARIFRLRVGWALVVFFVIQAARTLPYVGSYGIDALRDAALWYYALFVPIVFTLLAHDGALVRVQKGLTRAAPWICWLALPMWYLADVSSVFPYNIKGGDTLVFVALAYSWLTYVQRRNNNLLGLWMLVNLAVLGLINRGGLLAFLLICLPLILGLWKRLGGWALIPLMLIGGMYVSSSEAGIQVAPGKEISSEQLVTTFQSLFGSTGDSRLDSTREWRLNWWRDIVADSGPGGEAEATGRGYGVNLADYYGYQVNTDGSLRSPHNAWMTFLARSGIPGLLAYLAVLLTWAGYMLRRLRLAPNSARSPLLWALFGVAGVLLNSSVDVYLEGPVGGVTLWALLGFGLALAYWSPVKSKHG